MVVGIMMHSSDLRTDVQYSINKLYRTNGAPTRLARRQQKRLVPLLLYPHEERVLENGNRRS